VLHRVLHPCARGKVGIDGVRCGLGCDDQKSGIGGARSRACARPMTLGNLQLLPLRSRQIDLFTRPALRHVATPAGRRACSAVRIV
jgi:hypothetical protein